jgi:hypothetical protein
MDRSVYGRFASVNTVSDSFLLTTAGIAATLIGLLLLGGFFYLETGLRRAETVAPAGGPFLRATTKLTLMLYVIVLALSLGLVVLRPVWLGALYGVLAAALLAALVDWTLRYRDLRRVLPIPRSSPWITWPVMLAVLVLPWVVDGWEPSREAMTATALLAGAFGLMSTADLLLTSFDLASWEAAARRAVRPDTPPEPGDDRAGDGPVSGPAQPPSAVAQPPASADQPPPSAG